MSPLMAGDDMIADAEYLKVGMGSTWFSTVVTPKHTIIFAATSHWKWFIQK